MLPPFETYRAPELSPTTKKWFGLSLGGMLGCLAVLAWWRWHTPVIAYSLTALSAILVTIYYAIPASRSPVVNAFFLITRPFANMVWTLILVILYYLLFCPIGCILRLFGKDPLAKKPPAGRESYWIDRPDTSELERYFRQY